MKSYLFAASLLLTFISYAQPEGITISLHQLLQQAEASYPALQAGKMAIDAAKKNAFIIRSSALPSLDASYQLNYATQNNISGVLYPQFILPISGPPSGTNDMRAFLDQLPVYY